MNLNYPDLENEVLAILNQQKLWVLATASQNRVTARTVSIVNQGLTLYFQTDAKFIKALQILENPNVALCFSNVQIEGSARSLGHPLDPVNGAFAAAYRQFHPASYAKYSHFPNGVLIQVEPQLITLWKYIDDEPCRDFINLQTRTAQREYYAITH